MSLGTEETGHTQRQQGRLGPEENHVSAGRNAPSGAKERGLGRNRRCLHLDLELQVPELRDDVFLLFHYFGPTPGYGAGAVTGLANYHIGTQPHLLRRRGRFGFIMAEFSVGNIVCLVTEA